MEEATPYLPLSGLLNQELFKTLMNPTRSKPQTQLQELLYLISLIRSNIWSLCQGGLLSSQDVQPLLLQLDKAQMLLSQLLLSMLP